MEIVSEWWWSVCCCVDVSLLDKFEIELNIYTHCKSHCLPVSLRTKRRRTTHGHQGGLRWAVDGQRRFFNIRPTKPYKSGINFSCHCRNIAGNIGIIVRLEKWERHNYQKTHCFAIFIGGWTNQPPNPQLNWSINWYSIVLVAETFSTLVVPDWLVIIVHFCAAASAAVAAI